MSLGLVGRKVGMMRIFKDDGTSVPVTVLDCGGNRIAQIKSPESDGYCAVQVAFGKRRATRVTKAMAGHFAKAAVEAPTELREFRVTSEVLAELKVGAELKVDMFTPGINCDFTVSSSALSRTALPVRLLFAVPFRRASSINRGSTACCAHWSGRINIADRSFSSSAFS